MKTENTESEMGFDNEHIVMLPFLAKGHLVAFLALAKAIQQRTGFTITIATTPLNLKYLQATICSTPAPNTNIHLAELSFRSEDHGLPPNSENTEIVPPNDMLDLCAATMSLEAPARCLILDIIDKKGRPPLCIISDDLFYGWVTNLAENLGHYKRDIRNQWCLRHCSPGVFLA